MELTLLSTEQLIRLLKSIYANLDIKTITANKLDRILTFDTNMGTFSVSTYEDMWKVTDPVRGIVDDLLSYKTDYALTANQGRILKELIETTVSPLFKYKGNVKIENNIAIKLDGSPVELNAGNVYNSTMAGIIAKDNVSIDSGTIIVKLYENICWTNEGWDELGGIVDLSDYATHDWVDDRINTLNIELIGGTIPNTIKSLQDDMGVIATELDIINRTIV